MATEDQVNNARRGIGSRLRSSIPATFTIAGDGTYKAPVTLPAGSYLRAIEFQTPAAISGSPTHAYCQVGLTDGGQEVMAQADLQAQGHTAATIVAAHDKIASYATKATVLYIECVVSGGTSPAGTIECLVDYDAPVQ